MVRSYRLAAGALVLFLASGACSDRALTPVVSCESLATMELREATVTMAETVARDAFTPPVQGTAGGADGGPGRGGPPSPFQSSGSTDLVQPAFCRVAVTLTPSGDSDIKMELWLPLETWNGKFFGAGSFGWGGWIMYDGLLLGVKNGYAVANNDTGHTDAAGGTGAFGLGHPDKVVDYGYRANHEMTLQAKAIVRAFYGTHPARSYWVGCSLGGQQGLTEAQRFPEDYDGIVVGAPANPIVRLNAWQIWPSLLINEDPARAIPQAKAAMVGDAIIARCDELDGVKDGILENPLACAFDPRDMQCAGADAPDCLTPPQVDLLMKLYTGPVHSRTGELMHAPMVPGAVGNLSGGSPMSVATGLFQNLIFQDPAWDWRTLDMDTDIAFGEKVLGTVNVATNPNLKPFFDRGGKLLMYHGWGDGSSPVESFHYYDSVLKTVGPTARDAMRVFAIPGMGHCFGGPGCDTFSKLDAIDEWVETGNAPDRIVASKVVDGKVTRTHPLCAYPMVATYTGTGSTDAAESFVCAEVPTPDGAGR